MNAKDLFQEIMDYQMDHVELARSSVPYLLAQKGLESLASPLLLDRISDEEIQKEAEERYPYFTDKTQLIRREFFIKGMKEMRDRLDSATSSGEESSNPEKPKASFSGYIGRKAKLNLPASWDFPDLKGKEVTIEEITDRGMCTVSVKGKIYDHKLGLNGELILQPLPKPPNKEAKT